MRLIDRVYFSIARIGGTQTMLSVVENLGRGLGAFNRIRHRVRKHERFQTNEQSMGTDTTIPSSQNASCNGPLTIASSVTLTVNGNLTII